MRHVTAALLIGGLFLVPAHAERDSKGDRVRVRGDVILRGATEKPLLAVEQDGICDPALTDAELTRAFIAVSNVGGTALAFDLEGFNADGTALDPAHVETVIRIKDAANYRWMPTVVRVLGALEHADHATRLNAVQTAAETFRHAWSIVWQIDGPHSQALVDVFRAQAPGLTVLAPWNGDIQLVVDPDHAFPGRPAALLGGLPGDHNRTRNAILPDDPASYEALEAHNRTDTELAQWYPTAVGLTWEERLEGWEMLYNGRGMGGWTVMGDEEGFVSRDGRIEWARPGGWKVQSRDRYDDFVLRLEWKLHEPGANSGVFLRAPRTNRESKMGFEFQMMGDHGEAPHKNGTGAVYDVLAPAVNAARPVGEWNELEIYLNGPHYRATLNGEVIQDVNFDEHEELRYRLREGFISLQDHGDRVSFRNIRVKRL